ncbi:MAG: hypothetical protein WCT03_13260 [Candidatus Obscuribacterales bacterium]
MTERADYSFIEPVNSSSNEGEKQLNGSLENSETTASKAREAFAAEASSAPIISPADQERFGLKVRTLNGTSQAFYRAGGKDNIVISRDASSTGEATEQPKVDVRELLQAEIRQVEDTYKVRFAQPGELVEKQITVGSDCKTILGEPIFAKQPTFSDVFAMRTALEHSSPSQLTSDGKSGIKAYFLDKNLYSASVYGDKPALAAYISEDKNKQIAMYITPEGQKLPPTTLDALDSPDRTLDFTIEHELTHNSQRNQWPNYPFLPDKLPEAMGWKAFNRIENGAKVVFEAYSLKGKSGESFTNSPISCGENTAWLGRKGQKYITADEAGTENRGEAKHFSNDEVAANAVVKPATYYFPNPREMFSEGLTSFRHSAESRRRLLDASPKLYEVVENYDNAEIDKFYGGSESGERKFVRSLSGAVVPRNSPAGAEVDAFEKQ